jgi:hypothetical protein
MKFRIATVALSFVMFALFFPKKSAAVPSYSRQTGSPALLVITLHRS